MQERNLYSVFSQSYIHIVFYDFSSLWHSKFVNCSVGTKLQPCCPKQLQVVHQCWLRACLPFMCKLCSNAYITIHAVTAHAFTRGWACSGPVADRTYWSCRRCLHVHVRSTHLVLVCVVPSPCSPSHHRSLLTQHLLWEGVVPLPPEFVSDLVVHCQREDDEMEHPLVEVCVRVCVLVSRVHV